MALKKKTFYGSGKVYGVKLSNITYPILSKAAILANLASWMVEENQMGYVKGGFKFSISTETLDDQSDLGEMRVNLITKEKGTANFALFNANAETVAKWYPTGSVDTIADTHGTVEVAEVGGIQNMDDSMFIIIFHHQDTNNGDTIAVSVGKNMQGFDAEWTPDKVTPFACQFECQPYDNTGKLYMQVDTPVGYPWSDFGGVTVSSIAMKTQPTKTTYTVGEELDVTGAVITATYSDSSTADVTVTSAMCSGFDSTTAGSKTVTVTYESKTTTFTVTVTASE